MSFENPDGQRAIGDSFCFISFKRMVTVLALLLASPVLLFAQNSLNSGDFSTGSWGVGDPMGASAGGSLIITKGVSSSGDKYFRFFGDGSPCGDYQPNANGDFFTHDVVVTSPDANCGTSNAWRINVPTSSSNVVFKTDGGNDGMDRSIAFVIQGPVETVTSVTRAPSGTVYPGLDVVVTANLSADFSTGQAAWLRYTNDAFGTSTVVKMTGSGTTRTATIPGATNTPSTPVEFYVFTSSDGSSISGADADFYTINLDNNGGSNYTYTTPSGWIVDITGAWSNPLTWVGGNVPPTTENMGSITYDATVSNLTLDQDAIISSINLATGKTFTGSDGSPRTLTITGGGAFTKVGTFTQTAFNTTIFQNGGTISAATAWQNLQVGGGTLTPTGAQTINGTFQINAGGSISAAPTYGIASALIYNTGGSYGISTEWTSTAITGNAAAGRPNDVIIQNGTTLNMTTANRGIGRDVIIDATSTLNLNGTSGDLYLQRNWDNSGTFNPNGRAVGFTGTAISSTITNVAGETFDYLIVSKTTSGTVTLNNNVTIAGNSGDVLQMTTNITNQGSINLNGNDLSLTGTAGNISVGAAALIRNITGTGNLIISGGTKTVTRSATSTLVLAAGVNVQLSDGLNFGGFTTLNGTLTINSGGFVQTNSAIYTATSALVYNTGGPYSLSTEWTATAAGVAAVGRPNDVTVTGGTTLNFPAANRALARDLTIDLGSTMNLNATSGDLFVVRNWTNEGTFNPNGSVVNFSMTGNWSISRTVPGGETFDYLTISKTAASTGTFNCDVTIAGNTGNVLSATANFALTFDLGGNSLIFTNNGGSIPLPSSTTATTLRTFNNGSVYFNGTKSLTRAANTRVFNFNTAIYLNAALTVGVAGIFVCSSTVQINSSGSVVTNPPTYGAASMLIFNQGGSVTTGLEWNQAAGGVAGAGRPADVTIDNNTDLELTASRGSSRHLLVKTGSSLTLNAATGSIIVGGSWTREAGSTFTHNNRLTTLGLVNNTSVIDVPGGEDFGPLTMTTKAATTYTTMNCDVTVNGAFNRATNSGRLSIGSNTLTLNNTVTTVLNTGTISSDGTSNLVINGSGATCTLYFTTAVAENQLGSLVINRSTAGNVVLATNLTIDNTSGLNNSILTLTQGWLTINAGVTLMVNNTSIVGNTSSFITTLTTGRFGYNVLGAGTYTLDFPIGSAANVNSFRPLSLNSVAQTNDNVYILGAIVGTALSVNPTFNAPILGGSTVRYFPIDFGNLGVLTSIGSVSMTVGSDDNPSGIDNQTIIQDFGGGWNDLGAIGGATKTSTSAPDLTSATTTFAFGFATLSTAFVNQLTGDDSYTGQTSNNVPAGSGPKKTFAAAMASITNGGTINYTQGNTTAFVAQDWDIDKNIHLTQNGSAANCNLTNVTINVLNKAVMPFTAAQVNTTTNRITITAHQLVTGMALRYNNLGEPFGFMPSGINVGTDVLTVGGNISTGQAVIYQAYPAAGEAGGLTHGTTYYAINASATTIKLAASYSDALSSTAIDITSAGTAESHGIIASVAEGLTDATTYYAIVIDANTIQLAASNSDALDGVNIDLLTTGRGNHVLVFTPIMTNILSFKNPINITGTSALIDPFTTLVAAAGTINLTSGTFFMQPTIVISKGLTLSGAGIGSTILDGGGKISSATGYYGIAYPTITLGVCTIKNFTVTGYYTGIYRNSPWSNTSNVIDSIESSDNFNRGLTWEGVGAITTALTIRHSIFNYNNGVGVYSAGIYINGMPKAGLNIRNNTCIGNRNVGIEIGPSGTNANFFIKENTVTGVNSVSPLHNSTTEFGIVATDVTPTGSNTHISDNVISMYGRVGIECRGCVGNGRVSGTASFRIAGNYITQAGGPFRVEPNTSLQNDLRDVAGIAVGQMDGSAVSSGMAVDTNQVVGLQQPFSATANFTAFGIVVAGVDIVLRANIVSGCEIGIQPQQGSSGDENNTPDNFYSRDNTATTSNFLANRNSIISNTVFGVRNQGLAGIVNFMGNWWGDENGPTHASNTNSGFTGFGAGAGEVIPTGTTIAYNGHMSVQPDDVVGTASGERGLQFLKGKNYRLKPAANSIQITGAGSNYIINQGIDLAQGSSPNISASDNLTDTLDLAPITWALGGNSILIRKRMYVRGNFGTGTRPKVTGNGSSVHNVEQTPNARMSVNIAAQGAGIEYLEIEINIPFFAIGVKNVMAIGDTVSSVASIINGLTIKNNLIYNTGSYNFTCYGIYLKSVNYSSDNSIINITGNTIGTLAKGFGAPIRIWSCRGVVANNTLTGAFSLRWGTPTVGGGLTEIYDNTFVGAVELNSPQANSTLNVFNNIFERNGTNQGAQGIEVRLARFPTTTINIYDNTFNNIGQSGSPYWGVLALRCQNLYVTNNIFNAHSGATDFQFIHASTRQQGTLANATDYFDNSIYIKGNQFNGNAAGASNKVAIQLARHRMEQTFGTIEVGGAGADANSFTGLNRYFELDPNSGLYSTLGVPYSILTGTPDATMTPMDVNFDASQNIYEVSGGDKLPSAMSKTELLELEDKIQHAIDYQDLGFVTVKPSNVFVTPASYISPFTTSPLILRGLNQTSDGWTVTTKTGTYNETVTIDKNLTFANNGNTILRDLTINGTGKTLTLDDDFDVSNGGVLTCTDGIIQTGSNVITVLNTAVGGISGGSASSHVNGNLKRAVLTGLDYLYPVGNGTDIQELTLNFTNATSLTDVMASFTNTAPGTNLDDYNEAGALYDSVLQSGYWIVEPNVGGTSTDYHMRLKPTNFAGYPAGVGLFTFGILKRVGAGNWKITGLYDDPLTLNRVFVDGTIRRSNLNGFSNFGIGASQDVPLPVRLSQFDATRSGEDVALQWKSQSEVNFSHFEVQRSMDGVQFETLALVSGKSETGATYRYMDLKPFAEKGSVLFYRLRLVDLGDKGIYSPVRVVKDKLTATTLEIYPNPSSDFLNVKVTGKESGTVSIYDAMGRRVLQQYGTLFNGLDISNLANGIYSLVYQTETKLEKSSFVKR